MRKVPNGQYNISEPGSLPQRIAYRQRERMFAEFIKACELKDDDTVLDVGATSDQTYESSNYVEAWLTNKSRITAVGIDDAKFLENIYPGLTYIRADGLELPFEKGSFDVVHASAVIEHVGCFENQAKFIKECGRVARRGFFLTTPNRFYPIEFHTVLPLLHWLPKPLFRKVMQTAGHEFFASEKNLNLMSISDVKKAASVALPRSEFNFNVSTVKLLGLSSNILLHGTRVT